MLLHPAVSKNETAQSKSQNGPAFRVIEIQRGELGYSNFETMAITSKEDFDTFLREITQLGWSNRQAFQDALTDARIDFNQETLILLRHSEGSSGVQVSFEPPVLRDKTLLTEIRGALMQGMATGDMAYYCFALAVSKSLVNKVELNAVSGLFELRHLPTIVLSTTEKQPLKFVRPPPPRTSPPDCPRTRIQCPSDMPETGKTYKFTLHVDGLNTSNDVTYIWSVSNGEILFGQGTRTLEIRVKDPRKAVTATASLAGIDPDCNGATASCSFGIN